MGLVDPDHKDVSDRELLEQIQYALRLVASDAIMKGAVSRNGPFMRLPLRQVLTVAERAVKDKLGYNTRAGKSNEPKEQQESE